MKIQKWILIVTAFFLIQSKCAKEDTIVKSEYAFYISHLSDSVLCHTLARDDYANNLPLFDALMLGFKSIETDVYLADNELLVGNDLENLDPEKTLQKVYLDPLREIVQNREGYVYRDQAQLILLIDIKSEALPTYKALHQILGGYKDLVSAFTPELINEGAVLVVITGNRPIDYMEKQPVRFAACEGTLENLKGKEDKNLFPLVCESWKKLFKWNGEGNMPLKEETILHSIVDTAHQNGKMVRFLQTPDFPSPQRQKIWEKLIESNVDLITTNDMEGLEQFLSGQIVSEE